MKDYYKILEISSDASKDEIKKAFRSLAKKYHPDRNKNENSAVKKFQDVNEAYSVLSNEESKAKYDKQQGQSKKDRNQKTESNQKTKSKRTNTKNQSGNIEELNKYFESFFGFNANSNVVNKEKMKKNKNPIDTSNMFEGFFKIK